MSEKILVLRKVASGKEFHETSILRSKIYKKYGYFPKEEEMLADVDEYDLNGKSVHFVASLDKQVVGTIRLILANKTRLPIEREFKLSKEVRLYDKNRTVEVSRMVSNNNETRIFPDNQVMFGLIKAIHDYSITHDLPFWFAAIDIKVYNYLQKVGIKWNKIGQPRVYLGSETIPVMLFLPDAMKMLHHLNGSVWKTIYKGTPQMQIKV